MDLRTAVSLLPTPTTQDGANNGGKAQMKRNTLPLNARVKLLPTPNASDATGGGAADGREGHSAQIIDRVLHAEKYSGWGQYMAAIRRWERVTDTVVPNPTEIGTKGNPRLNAQFSEWMMGLHSGWVTALVGPRNTATAITRSAALKMIGNGVVPQQARQAIADLLEGWE